VAAGSRRDRALATAAAGCTGKPGVAAAPREHHPLPPDTMTLALPEIGHYGGRFVIGQTASPKTFNAMMANETSSNDVNNRLWASLMDYDNGAARDTFGLAKAYEMSPDGLTWTWHLRRGLAFSDGHPLTADDVAVLVRGRVRREATPGGAGPAQDRRQALRDLGAGPVHHRDEDRESPTRTWWAPCPRCASSRSTSSRAVPPRRVRVRLRREHRAREPGDERGWRLKQFVQNEKTVLEPNPW
jgi:hypothetical protein